MVIILNMRTNNLTRSKYKAKSPKKSKRVLVNRILLKSLMLKQRIEYYKDLADRVGISRDVFYSLVSGRKYYPRVAEKVEEFLGVEKGRIFRRV